MGCAVSKLGDSSLLSLCKERKELIMAATNYRYALASSHILYLRALLDVGDALSQFVDEGAVSSVDSPQNSLSKDCLDQECIVESLNPNSDDESLSSLSNDESPISVANDKLLGEDAHLVFPLSDSNSDSELGSLSSHMDFDEMELLGLSPLSDQFQTSANPNVSNVRFSAQTPSAVYECHPVYPVTAQWQESSQSYTPYDPMNVPLYDLIHPQDGNGAPSFAPINVPHYDLMRPHGRNGASFEHLRRADGASFNAPINFPINDPRFPQYGNGSPLGGSMEMWHHDHVPYDNQVQETPAPVLMPPQPELTNQDYFHPFSLTADIFPNHYSPVRYETESSSNIPDLSEVRQREGIPDLEDELEEDVKGGLASAEELKSGLNAIEGIEGEANTTEGGGSDALESNTMEEVNDKKKESLQEVVKEIKGAFLSTFNYGKEVSMLLEADKLPYQYTGSKFKGKTSYCFVVLLL